MASEPKKSLGEALDIVIEALKAIDESTRIIVIKAACEHLNIPIHKGKDSMEEQPALDTESPSAAQYLPKTQQKIQDIRTLKEIKNPSNDIEMVCVMAYYLQELAPDEEKKTFIQNRDIDEYFKQAKFPLPKHTQTLINAKTSGYLDSAGRGKYKLNPVGYNLVVHSLPRKKNK